MQPTTLRLPEELGDELATEADELGFSSRSEYIRHILRNRSDTEPNTPSSRTDTEPNTGDYVRSRRVDELEARVTALEAELHPDNSGDTRESRETSTQRAESRRDPQPSNSKRRDEQASSGTGFGGSTGEPRHAALEAVDAMEWTDAPRGDPDDYRDALRAVVDAIHTADDGLSASDIRDELYPEHPVGFDDSLNWWKNLVLKRLQELRDKQLVHTEGGGRYTTWHVGSE